MSGVVANENVNADKAEEVGDNIIASMAGKSAKEFSFCKKNQVVTLASKRVVGSSDGSIKIDSQLLFQRLCVLAACGRIENPQELFQYEMCSFPPALFESQFLPRQANKPVLANPVWERTKQHQTDKPPGDTHYVLDGGSLHHLPWPRGSTYESISVSSMCSAGTTRQLLSLMGMRMVLQPKIAHMLDVEELDPKRSTSNATR